MLYTDIDNAVANIEDIRSRAERSFRPRYGTALVPEPLIQERVNQVTALLQVQALNAVAVRLEEILIESKKI